MPAPALSGSPCFYGKAMPPIAIACMARLSTAAAGLLAPNNYS